MNCHCIAYIQDNRHHKIDNILYNFFIMMNPNLGINSDKFNFLYIHIYSSHPNSV